jgi:hypothetical protein
MGAYEVSSKKLTGLGIVVAVSLALILALTLAPRAHAQEITPAADTYSFGSTSEFSPYSTLSQGSSSSLAPTGQNMVIGYVAIAAVLAIAGGTTYMLVRNKKQVK